MCSASCKIDDSKIVVMANSLLGWERFFEELTEFIRTCNRQSGTANQSFAEYALERIQTAIQSVSIALKVLRQTVTMNLLCLKGTQQAWANYDPV